MRSGSGQFRRLQFDRAFGGRARGVVITQCQFELGPPGQEAPQPVSSQSLGKRQTEVKPLLIAPG